MKLFPVQARGYIVLISLGGVLSVAGCSFFFQTPSNSSVGLVAFFLLLVGVVADIFHVHLYSPLQNRIESTMSTAGNFAAMLLFGPVIAVWIGALSSAIPDIWQRKSLWKIAFNAANTVFSVVVSALVFYLADGSGGPALGSFRNAGAITLSGLAYLCTNAAILFIGIGLVEGHNPWQVYRSNLRGVTFQIFTLVPIGTLIVLIYAQNPWGLPLVLFPIVVAHFSFDNYQRLRIESLRTMELLADTVDQRDPYTYHHSHRVADYSIKIAKHLRLDIETLDAITLGARVHDLGKIGVDSSALRKPGPLNEREWEIMRAHPQLGADILSRLSLYSNVKDLVEYHQERFNGTGYPHKARGNEIPLGARILAVADAFDAMTTDRPYRAAMPARVAIKELEDNRGTQFDPRIVDAFIAVLHQEGVESVVAAGAPQLAGQQQG